MVLQKAGVKHLAAFVFVRRREHRYARQTAQKGEIKTARMGRPISANQAGPVNRQQHWQFLQGDVVNQLIIGALQEGRVNRHHRLQAFTRESRSKG